MTEQEKNLEGKLKVPYFEISGKTTFNIVGKLIGGYILYKLGKFIGGDFGAIVGAYTGLRCNYYPCKNALAEITFKEK